MYTLMCKKSAKEFCYIDVLKKHIHRESYSEERSINTTWIWHLHNKEHTFIHRFLHKSILFNESTRAIWNLNAANLVFIGLRKEWGRRGGRSPYIPDSFLIWFWEYMDFFVPSSLLPQCVSQKSDKFGEL